MIGLRGRLSPISACLCAVLLVSTVVGCGDDPSRDAGKISISEAKAQSGDSGGEAGGKSKGASRKVDSGTGRGRPGAP